MSSGHHRHSKRSSDYGSSSGRSASRRCTRASTNRDTDAPGGHSCPTRSNGRSSSSMGSPDSLPSWVILNKYGARRDSFRGDRTTSTTYRNSDGKEISVSFELVEPPGTSVLVVECPLQEPGPAVSALRHSCRPTVIGVHRDVVLLEIFSPCVDNPSDHFLDYLVYQASSGGSCRRPSLSLLPASCVRENDEDTGIMSCARSQEDDSSFIVAHLTVAHLRIWPRSKPPEITVHMFRSWSGDCVDL